MSEIICANFKKRNCFDSHDTLVNKKKGKLEHQADTCKITLSVGVFNFSLKLKSLMQGGQTEVIFVIKRVLWYLCCAMTCSFRPMPLSYFCHFSHPISILQR